MHRAAHPAHLSSRTDSLHLTGRTGSGPRLAACLLALGLVGCARAAGPTTVGVQLDPRPAHVTPHGDLEILRHRAAMGLTGAVRAELAPRIADNPSGPDPGRDALRGLAIELALVQDDREAARLELDRLERGVLEAGDRASPELRASSAVLRGAWLYAEARYADARSSHLRALVALDRGGPATSLTGTALRALARDQLALGEAETAVNTLGRAIEIHREAPGAHIELHEDLLLAIDVMLAVKQPNEAVIIAGDAYNQALTKFGPDTLPHAEALLGVGAATLASGDREAARTVVGDAREILDALAQQRSDPALPISRRAVLRCAALLEALKTTPV